MYEMKELPALGDSGFYLGQASDVIEKGTPSYPLANLRSAALAGLVMNLVITYAPALSVYFSSLVIAPGLWVIGVGRLFNQNLVILTTTASVYFLKPDYMDFYPVAVVVGVIATYHHLRFFEDLKTPKLIIAAVTSGLAIASHLLLVMISIAYVAHRLLAKTSIQNKLKELIIYCAIVILVFNLTMFFLSLMNWPLIPGNSMGGGDGKYLAQDLVSLKQITHASSVITMAIIAPMTLLFLSINYRTLQRYITFLTTLCAVYVMFLMFYGFDLGLVPDTDLQIFPSTVIVGAICLIFMIEKVEVKMRHAILMAPFAIYAANSISNLPK
jgi:hypothetical protein